MPSRLARAAAPLAEELARAGQRIVFAESCTGGLVAATLAETPGISEPLCGSAVTYREATKIRWLGVSPRDLARHTAVSEQVARQMALGVLKITPEADYSAAVTGHLGPQAPPELEGVIFVAVARRSKGKIRVLQVERLKLKARSRRPRQREAAEAVLRAAHAVLAECVQSVSKPQQPGC